MKVLVTGAGGQLGSALARRAPAGISVLAVDRTALDIGDRAAVQALVQREQPALIINAAAYTAVDKAETERELAFRINGEAVGHLAEAAAARSARLIHVSTDYVFDGTKATAYTPADATNPLSVYGQSKLAGERAALERCPDALVVRTAWVYAATGRNFVLTMRKLIRERPEVRVVADQYGAPTHADSLARALWRYAALPSARGIQHWTDGGGPISWFDFASEIRAQLARAEPAAPLARVTAIATSEYPTPARRPQRAVLDISGSTELIGEPRPWKEELVRCLSC